MQFKVGDVVRYCFSGRVSMGRVIAVDTGEYIVNEGDDDDEYTEERDTIKIDWCILDPWGWGKGKYWEFVCDYIEGDLEIVEYDPTAPD